MYELTLNFNPACAEAHNNLGVLYKEGGNLERAVECYQSALTIRPDFPQVSHLIEYFYPLKPPWSITGEYSTDTGQYPNP